MIRSSRTSSTTPLLGKAARPLRLRVRGGPSDGQVITVRESKCLVGADERCQLQLQIAAPIACWILRGERHTLLRAMTGDLQVNGEAVAEAAIRSGDQIGLGGCMLDVLGPKGQRTTRQRKVERTPRARQAPPASALQGADAPKQLEHAEAALAAAERAFVSRQTEWDAWQLATRQQLDARLAELAQQLHSSTSASAALAQERDAWQRERQSQLEELLRQRDALSEAHVNLERERATLAAEEQRLVEERHQVAREREKNEQTYRQQLGEHQATWDVRRQELEAEHAQLEDQRATLAARVSELDQSVARLEQEKRELETHTQERADTEAVQTQQNDAANAEQRADLERQAAELEHVRAELDARVADLERQAEADRAALELERQAWLNEQRRQQEQLETRADQLDEHARELNAERDALHASCQQLEAERAELDQRQAEIKQEEPPQEEVEVAQVKNASRADTETDDVFQRLALAGILKQDTECDDSLGTPVAPASELSQSLPAVSEAEGDEEESIDTYMAKLLARARQQGGVAPPTPTKRAEPKPAAAAVAAPSAVDAEPVATLRRERAKAAELNHDMAAMRELANLSARSAIDRHARSQQKHSFGAKVGLVIVAICSGSFILALEAPQGSVYWYAALASFAIAVLWGAQVAPSAWRMARANRVAGDKPAESIGSPEGVAAECAAPQCAEP
ncbi:MAG: hypothetical protein K1X71_02415 [Pirellulales bacterium]|nr:hypothetical protein [Pirellulales bacterium]